MRPSPSVRSLLDDLGISYQLEKHRLDQEKVGTSPGEAYWTGRRLLIGSDAEDWHVFHEAAHHLYCLATRPDDVFEPNWGHERGEEWIDEDECASSNLTVLLLAMYRRPYLKIAHHLNVLDMALCKISEDAHLSEQNIQIAEFFGVTLSQAPTRRSGMAPDQGDRWLRSVLRTGLKEVSDKVWPTYVATVEAQGRTPRRRWT